MCTYPCGKCGEWDDVGLNGLALPRISSTSDVTALFFIALHSEYYYIHRIHSDTISMIPDACMNDVCIGPVCLARYLYFQCVYTNISYRYTMIHNICVCYACVCVFRCALLFHILSILAPSAAPQARPDREKVAQCSRSSWVWPGLQSGVPGESNMSRA